MCRVLVAVGCQIVHVIFGSTSSYSHRFFVIFLFTRAADMLSLQRRRETGNGTNKEEEMGDIV